MGVCLTVDHRWRSRYANMEPAAFGVEPSGCSRCAVTRADTRNTLVRMFLNFRNPSGRTPCGKCSMTRKVKLRDQPIFRWDFSSNSSSRTLPILCHHNNAIAPNPKPNYQSQGVAQLKQAHEKSRCYWVKAPVARKSNQVAYSCMLVAIRQSN